MTDKRISCSAAVEGQVFHCPAKLMIGRQKNELIYGGTIKWGGRPVSDAIKETDESMSGQIGVYVDRLLPKCQPEQLSLIHQNNRTVIGIRDSNMYFKLAVSQDNKAVIFAFQIKQKPDTESDVSALLMALEKVAGFFGIQEFLFYAQTGRRWMLPELAPGKVEAADVPREVKDCSFLVYTRLVMDGDNVFMKTVRTLFGMNETELFVGMGAKGAAAMLTIPGFKNDIMESKNLYMMVQMGKKMSFLLKGSFIFNYVPQMRFQVDCEVGMDAFEIEALAHVEKPVPLFGPFSIGDTCLMIRVSEGFSFGMYTSLYIRKIQIFGALILKIRGELVTPELLSAAVSDLSIPILLDNLLGEHINGIEALDFIKILGLPFQNAGSFSREVVEQKNLPAIVEQFNSRVNNPSLNLELSQVQLTPFGDGADLADLKRMRHYYIKSSGELQLAAQFYYSSINTRLGNYSVERGLFICGVIEIFGKRIEVLFSYRESEGILGYAKIQEMDLGFIRIGPSQVGGRSSDTLPVAQDSVLSQFINPEQAGLVFFLSAGKRNISFYLDGNVNVLRLFEVDARIIFCQGLISVDLCTTWLGILQISLHLKVNYGSFSSGSFEFSLTIDTSKLTEKLQSVTRSIEAAIGRLRQRIDNANREIDRAQNHVNELYGKIHDLDRRIQNCRNDIRNASWWKKAFVAIAKGIEIGAYEVAKAGVYAAIGVATAALEVAKGLVNIGGILGEGVLRAVNGVVQGAMSLFYLNYIRLTAKANSAEQYFMAEIDFVALGTTYHFTGQIGKEALKKSPEGALSQKIQDQIQPDLNRIEQAATRSNWRKYRYEKEPVSRHCRRLDGARQHIAASIEMMQSMQNTYVEQFETPMEEFDAMNVSLTDALGHVENVLCTGVRAADVPGLEEPMDVLRQHIEEKSGSFRDRELSKAKELMDQYDEAKILYDKVAENLEGMRDHRKMMEEHADMMKEKTSACGAVVINGSGGDPEIVLEQVQEQLYQCFPVDRSGADFINLSREPLIQECFQQAEQRIGMEPSDKIQRMRKRSRKGKYEARL